MSFFLFPRIPGRQAGSSWCLVAPFFLHPALLSTALAPCPALPDPAWDISLCRAAVAACPLSSTFPSKLILARLAGHGQDPGRWLLCWMWEQTRDFDVVSFPGSLVLSVLSAGRACLCPEEGCLSRSEGLFAATSCYIVPTMGTTIETSLFWNFYLQWMGFFIYCAAKFFLFLKAFSFIYMKSLITIKWHKWKITWNSMYDIRKNLLVLLRNLMILKYTFVRKRASALFLMEGGAEWVSHWPQEPCPASSCSRSSCFHLEHS